MLLPIREEVIAGLFENVSRNCDNIIGELWIVTRDPTVVVLQKSVNNAAGNVIELSNKSAARGDGIGRNPEVPVEQTRKSTCGILVDLLTEPLHCLVIEHRNSYIVISCLKKILDEVICRLCRVEVNEIFDAVRNLFNACKSVLNDDLKHAVDVIGAVVFRIRICKTPNHLSEHNFDIQIDLYERVGNAERDTAVSLVLTDTADDNLLDDSLVVRKELKERLDDCDISGIASARVLDCIDIDAVQIAGHPKDDLVAVDQLIDARKSIVYRRRIKLTENRKIHRDVLFGKRLVSVVKKRRRILLRGQNRSVSKVVRCQRVILISLVRTRAGGSRWEYEQWSKDDC